MKSYIWLGLLLALLAGNAGAATNATPQVPLVSSGPCVGSTCPGVANDATHAWFFAPATGATFAVTGTFWQATQPVSGTFWQATQPVSLATAPPLAAGSAIVGKVGIDQTTPGTTNGVVVNSSALPSGASSATNQTNVQSAPGTPQTAAVTVQGNAGGVPVPVSGNVTTTPVSTATQTTNTITTVAITATSGTLVAANSGRKSLAIMNIGANSCTVTTVNPAVSGSGTVYASGGPFPSQGGSSQYDSKVPVNAYFAICPAGLSTTFSVEEGN